jgi:hypothetical protein
MVSHQPKNGLVNRAGLFGDDILNQLDATDSCRQHAEHGQPTLHQIRGPMPPSALRVRAQHQIGTRHEEAQFGDVSRDVEEHRH